MGRCHQLLNHLVNDFCILGLSHDIITEERCDTDGRDMHVRCSFLVLKHDECSKGNRKGNL